MKSTMIRFCQKRINSEDKPGLPINVTVLKQQQQQQQRHRIKRNIEKRKMEKSRRDGGQDQTVRIKACQADNPHILKSKASNSQSVLVLR